MQCSTCKQRNRAAEQQSNRATENQQQRRKTRNHSVAVSPCCRVAVLPCYLPMPPNSTPSRCKGTGRHVRPKSCATAVEHQLDLKACPPSLSTPTPPVTSPGLDTPVHRRPSPAFRCHWTRRPSTPRPSRRTTSPSPCLLLSASMYGTPAHQTPPVLPPCCDHHRHHHHYCYNHMDADCHATRSFDGPLSALESSMAPTIKCPYPPARSCSSRTKNTSTTSR